MLVVHAGLQGVFRVIRSDHGLLAECCDATAPEAVE